jgi:membrane protease YdiL (CAAX protease family)
MNSELKPFWNRFFSFSWKFGLVLLIIVCIPRFILVLNANVTGSYNSIALIMIVSALAPFIFLTKKGLKQIGITKPQNYKWLLVSFFSGIIFSIFLYFVGDLLYGDSYNNWYKYIGKSYNIPAEISLSDKKIYFFIFAFTGMIFSPIGEELFFRGIVHSAFAKSVGDFKASIFDSTAFAITHISHFGLVFLMNQWDFLTIPAIIWVLNMFLAGILFFYFSKKSNSILGAIVCHSGFNLGMTYSIFYLL